MMFQAVFVPAEWKTCQMMVVMITAPQTVSAYNLVGITFIRFLAVKDPLHFKDVRMIDAYNDVTVCL